jgi:ubiquinone biosynthesis accessory factor UbiK
VSYKTIERVVHFPGACATLPRSSSVRYLLSMIDKRFFDDLNERIGEAFRNSPAQDIEKNLKALLASGFARLDLVLREDFEVQQKLLERAQAKLAELETRITELESKRDKV